MKKIVYRKIAKDCLNFFLVITFTISLIIWVLQAVNYLDFVIEDGHSFLVYFKYTLFSFPKILSRIFPFSIFLAFSYIFLKYENKNELVIFWNFGIKKINFINFFIKFSLFFTLLSLLLNAIITPFTQDRARSFIRSSDLGFFESMLKPKKFIDAFGNLTIYFDEKNNNGELKNIFLNERTDFNNSQTTFAKTGLIKKNNNNNNNKILELYDGRTINNVNGKSSEFSFAKTDYNMSNFGTKTITQQKVQETSTMDLIECSFLFNSVKISSTKEINDIINCTFENLENIYEEIYSRLLKPLYTTFLITISLLIILKSRSDPSFNLNKLKIYLFGFIFVIFIESSSKFISLNLMQNLLFVILPFFLTLTIYLYFITALRVARK
jgi:lipopolysaccharide export system permease protein